MTAPIIALAALLSLVGTIFVYLAHQPTGCHAPAKIEWPLRRITTEADI